MKKTVLWIGLGLALLTGGTAMAQGYYGPRGPDYQYGSLYLGASAGTLFYNENGLGTINPTIAVFHVGEQFSPYIAIEGRIGTTVNGDDWDGYHVDAQAVYGAYAKGILPITPWVSLYAIAGLGGAQIHRNYPDANTNDVGFSYGLGGEVNLGGGASLNLEYARLTSGTNDGYDYNADTLMFGVNWHIW